MPPPDAVKEGKVKPLSDEDKLTLVRWIDLGCPIDFEYDANKPDAPGGWLLDDQRPTLTLTYPAAGKNEKLERILLGMCDFGTGLDVNSLDVVADFAVNGIATGENLARQFEAKPDGVWELKLKERGAIANGKLTIAVKDKQGNISRIERTFSVGK
jgi:hypothetical protein